MFGNFCGNSVAFLLVLNWIVEGVDFDAVEEKFCELSCKGVENTACKCKKAKGCLRMEFNQTHLVEFRTRMLKRHNEYRDRLASGADEEKYKCPGATNMNVLNYDVGLEYSAFCHSSACGLNVHDVCRTTRKFQHLVGQNMGTFFTGGFVNAETEVHHKHGSFNESEYRNYEHMLNEFYDEIILFNTNKHHAKLDSFVPTTDNVLHFTCMNWASLTHVGCMFTYMKHKKGVYYHKGVCNYGSEYDDCAPNCTPHPVYKKGKSCTECRKGMECNSVYKHLCGKILPIPSDEPYTKAELALAARSPYPPFLCIVLLIMCGSFLILCC